MYTVDRYTPNIHKKTLPLPNSFFFFKCVCLCLAKFSACKRRKKFILIILFVYTQSKGRTRVPILAFTSFYVQSCVFDRLVSLQRPCDNELHMSLRSIVYVCDSVSTCKMCLTSILFLFLPALDFIRSWIAIRLLRKMVLMVFICRLALPSLQ